MFMKDIIEKYTNTGYSEPSETAVKHFKASSWRLFKDCGYIHEDIPQFGTILDFMARYKIATLNHEVQMGARGLAECGYKG